MKEFETTTTGESPRVVTGDQRALMPRHKLDAMQRCYERALSEPKFPTAMSSLYRFYEMMFNSWPSLYAEIVSYRQELDGSNDDRTGGRRNSSPS